MAEVEVACGEGLAEQGALPAKLGDVVAASADVLEHHMTALDTGDENAKQELAAYQKLTEEHRETAERLRAAGERMAGYRELPEAKHDREVLSSPQAAEAFERFVAVEQELCDLLEQRLVRDKTLLDKLRRAEDATR